MKRLLIAATLASFALVSHAADVKKGQELVAKGNCAACHGEGLNKPVAPEYPKLAGQHEDYIYYALKAYQTENNPQVGRNNAVMASQAKQLTHAQLKDIAAYVASLPSEFVVKK